MKKRWILSFLMITLLSPLYADLKDDIIINLEERRIRNMEPDGLELVFYVNISNSSSNTYSLSAYRFRMMVGESEYLRLERPLEEGVRLDPSRTTMIALPVKITYAYLFQTIPSTASLDIIPCTLMGDFAFSEGRRSRGSLPFAFSGEFPVYHEPVLRLNSFQAKEITIGGADLAVEYKLENPNGFDISQVYFRYELKFGGHSVKTGSIKIDQRIAAHAAESVTIPVLVNFFEVGKDVLGLLQQETMNCRIFGELEFHTPWERLTRSFDTTERIRIEHGSGN